MSTRTQEVESERKSKLRSSIQYQVDKEKQAHQIVEELVLQDSVSNQYLLSVGNWITPSHYKDVIEERTIAHRCGYPVCSNPLTQIPKQKYKICTRTNTVYDITERKLFCSNFCFKASKFFEEQIPKTPLVLRDKRSVQIELLTSSGGTVSWSSFGAGDAVALQQPVDEKSAECPEQSSAVSWQSDHCGSQGPLERIRDTLITDGVLKEERETPETETSSSAKTFHPDLDEDQNQVLSVNELAKDFGLLGEETTEHSSTVASETEKKSVRKPSRFKEHREAQSKITGRATCPQNNLNTRIKYLTMNPKSCQVVTHSDKQTPVDRNVNSPDSGSTQAMRASDFLIASIQATLQEWCTARTLEFLGLVSPLDSNETSDDKCTISESGPSLDSDDEEEEEEEEERHYDGVGDDSDVQGSCSIRNIDNPSEEVMKDLKIVETCDEKDRQAVPIMPLIDSKSQMEMRRRIILDRLLKILPYTLGHLGLSVGDLSHDLHHLVQTFSPTNSNVSLKPVEWKCLSLVILYILQGMNQSLQDAMVRRHSSYEQLLDRLSVTQEDVDRILTLVLKSDHSELGQAGPQEVIVSQEKYNVCMEDLD